MMHEDTVLILDDGWVIKLFEGSTQRNDIKRYYITHDHKGYSWPIVKTNIFKKEEAMYQSVTCTHCHKQVPKETLGFLELLKWETK